METKYQNIAEQVGGIRFDGITGIAGRTLVGFTVTDPNSPASNASFFVNPAKVEVNVVSVTQKLRAKEEQFLEAA